MTLQRTGTIELPAHRGEGGFDHAALDGRTGRLYVAHPANDAVEVVDVREGRHLRSISGLRGVAGVLVSPEADLLLTSNRGETSVSVIPLDDEGAVRTIPVGGRPNGLAFNPRRQLLLAANIDRPGQPGVYTASLVDLKRSTVVADINLPGRPRWAVFDVFTDRFYLNIRDPPQVVAVAAKEPTRLAATFEIPFAGPHGLELDDDRRRLFCACDDGKVARVDLRTNQVTDAGTLTGQPDVILLDPSSAKLYVALHEPGGVDILDANSGKLLESLRTELGSGTMALDLTTRDLYVLLQDSHAVGVYRDEGAGGPQP